MAQRILVVDDTPQNVRLFADLLRARGYEVTTAASGPDAEEAATAELDDVRPIRLGSGGTRGPPAVSAVSLYRSWGCGSASELVTDTRPHHRPRGSCCGRSERPLVTELWGQ